LRYLNILMRNRQVIASKPTMDSFMNGTVALNRVTAKKMACAPGG